ncbi:hypothetical protein NPA07_02070 [Mycoplasmopsis caviae]|uniref:Transposase n=1 Tax=Mycoplasmopsis caviae TaxID=55603 RepID=A0ABY5J0L5_9BACT|nr:hypothetical protein [Mycoplasmopsis caviae]UUD35636.1 hypothetical protein NPA07_02070 [Mycoplasmopsis caviae]
MKLDKNIKKRIVNLYKKGIIRSQISLTLEVSESAMHNVIT